MSEISEPPKLLVKQAKKPLKYRNRCGYIHAHQPAHRHIV